MRKRDQARDINDGPIIASMNLSSLSRIYSSRRGSSHINLSISAWDVMFYTLFFFQDVDSFLGMKPVIIEDKQISYTHIHNSTP